jgi:hypothetical protein
MNKEKNNKIKLINNGGSLSETDLQLIAGTDLVMQMMRNRVVVVTNNNDEFRLTKSVRAIHDFVVDRQLY